MVDNIQYGIISIIFSVVFLMSGLDLLETSFFSRGFSSLVAFVLVGIGAFLIGQGNK
jgi:hypothetical protein